MGIIGTSIVGNHLYTVDILDCTDYSKGSQER